MLTVRRIYLYLVSAISLVGVTWSVIGLARLIVSEGIGQGQIIGLATWLAIIIVGLPIFLFHWLMAQRLTDRDEEERSSIVRRIYFYGIMAAGATPIFSNIYRLVDNGLLALVDVRRPNYYPYDLTTAEHLAALLVWGVVWFYLWRQVRADDQAFVVQDASAPPPNEENDRGGVRRLYLLAFSLAGLVMVSWGATGLLRLLMQLPADVIWRTPMAHNIARLLVGGSIWVGHWLLLQQTFSKGTPAEERSVLRKLYLYLTVFVFSVMAVGSATTLLKRLIELALGGEPSPEPLLSQLSWPVPLVIVGAVFWAYHWQVLRHDANQAPEVPRQAGVRRIYAYLVAAIGLGVLLSGVGGLLSILVDLLTTPDEIGLAYYREQVALFTAMTVVGVPVWLIPWRAMQNLAVTPTPTSKEEAEGDGEAERRSTVRKIYLYLCVFVAAVAVFSSVGWFVFHILTALLGADLPDDFITQVLNALVISVLAAGVWFYHWWAIRQDGQLAQADQARKLKDILVVVIDGDEGKLGQTIIGHLQHNLPGLQLKPVGVTPEAVTAMTAQPFSAATGNLMETAHYVIGSWQVLAAAEVAPAVASSGARKLVVPMPDRDWVWTGVKQRSIDYYARQAARGVKQAIEGETITPARDIDLTTILAIIGGILLFLFIAGGLFAFVVSNF